MSTRPTRLSRYPSPFAIAAAVILLLSAAYAFGDEPRATIKAPAVAKVASLVVLDAGESVGDDFVWESTTGESFVVDTSGKRAYFVASSPGKYRFLLVAVGVVECKARLSKALIEVQVDGVAPQPVPPGPPSPTPPPAPVPSPDDVTPFPVNPLVTGRLFVTYLADANNLTQEQTSIKAAPEIRKAFGSLDATWRWYQSDESEPQSLNLTQHAPSYPCVIIQSKDGKVVGKITGQITEVQVIEAVKKLRSGK